MSKNLATSLFSEGRYFEASRLLEQKISALEVTDEASLFLLARSLIATSRYDEAFNLLLLCMTSRENKHRALGLQAEIRWIQHRYNEAYNLSLAALELNLFSRRVQTIRNRCNQFLTGSLKEIVEGVQGGYKFGHAAFYVAPGGNFGDLALPPTIRASVGHWKPVSEWTNIHVHQHFNSKQVDAVNQLDGLVIGGGGLFLPDTSPNGNSGWQWNVAKEDLYAIDVPIYIVAVGYNLFEGQQFHGDTFRRSLTAIVDRASLIGLRNSGSIAKVRALLPDRLAEKVQFMPCPTTILSKLIEDELDETDITLARSRVFINAAFDRSERRFGLGYEAFLDSMARYVSALQRDGVSVELAAHLPRDEKLGKDLFAQFGIRMPVHGFYDMDCLEGYNLYRQAGLVVGMRGHATMIPFGLNVPVLSIVSHPKMQFFLNDIEHPEWGVSVQDADMSEQLYQRSVAILENNEKVRGDLHDAQNKLYASCQSFLSQIV